MGITGTDVSKGAADMILLDDNFATIVSAVEEGRIIYDNIRRFIRYLLTCNASEIAVMLLGPLFGMPLPLLPLQILWMNLVTDGPPALALGVEPAEKNVMKRPPRTRAEGIFGREMVSFILVIGVLMSITAIAAAWELWRPRRSRVADNRIYGAGPGSDGGGARIALRKGVDFQDEFLGQPFNGRGGSADRGPAARRDLHTGRQPRLRYGARCPDWIWP